MNIRDLTTFTFSSLLSVSICVQPSIEKTEDSVAIKLDQVFSHHDMDQLQAAPLSG